jgi:hypothetical protein
MPMATSRALLAALLAVPLCACHTGSSNTLAGAAVMTTLAGGVSAARRANGECYVDCLPGTRCNRQTGLCDALPCRDKCNPGEVCTETETGSACVPASGAALGVQSTKGAAVPRTADAEKAGKAIGDKPAVPAAALQPGATPPPAPKKAEGEKQGPTPPIIRDMADPTNPANSQSLIDSSSSPPPR